MRLFTLPEKLDEHNSWYCSRCQEHRQAVKTVKLWRLPEVLIISLKRFEVREGYSFTWGGGASTMNLKIDTPVDFPVNGLDLSMYCHELSPLRGGAIYDLFAICNHYGRIGFGHYTAFARDWVGSDLSRDWFCYDDESVTACNEDDVRRAVRASYIFFYRKRPSSC